MSLVDISNAGAPVEIDQGAVLRALNLNPRDPKTQALLLVCQRYGLDPILKHMVLVEGNPYLTRDGLLHVAHRSGQLDGIVVEEETESGHEYRATVSVWRKDWSRPSTFRGRYPKTKKGKDGKHAPVQYGPEMAVKCAESHALRRAFDVSGLPVIDEMHEPYRADPVTAATVAEADRSNSEQLARINELSAGLDDDGRSRARGWVDDHGIDMTQMSAAEADAIIGMLLDLAADHPPPSEVSASGTGGARDTSDAPPPSAPDPKPEVQGGVPRGAKLNKRFLQAAVDHIELPDYLDAHEIDAYRTDVLCQLAFVYGFRVNTLAEIGSDLAERLITHLEGGRLDAEGADAEPGYEA